MKALNYFAVVALATTLCSALAQQSTPPPPAELPDAPATQAPPALEPSGPTAVIDTSMGRVTCRLYEKEAPETVANFIGLAEGSKDWTDPVTHKKMHNKSLYNGTTFHRVIPEFMIQGGDPTGTGTGDPGYYFKDEFNENINFNVPGRLAMANSGPNTNGSQFFVTEVPTEYLNQKHTIFGQCDDPGVLVVKSIARVERSAQDKPLEDVVLSKITIVREGQPMPPAPSVAAPSAATKPQP